MWGETTRVENRGETARGGTTRGETSWGRNVLLPLDLVTGCHEFGPGFYYFARICSCAYSEIRQELLIHIFRLLSDIFYFFYFFDKMTEILQETEHFCCILPTIDASKDTISRVLHSWPVSSDYEKILM